MVEVSTSILNANEEEIIKTIYNLEVAKADYFHIDVMDGEFVKNNTTEKMRKYTEYIKQVSNLPIDVHLMVNDVEKYVAEYLNMEVNCISFQIEACKKEKQIPNLITNIKANNCKVGLAISPKTEIEKLYEYIPYIHKVIVMTVEPGEGGQELIKETISKVFELNKFIYENGYEVDIEVDGGINAENSKELTDVGANILVVGSYILNSNDYNNAIKKLKIKE
jgi:ribulose-phosphate 3-epimerase